MIRRISLTLLLVATCLSGTNWTAYAADPPSTYVVSMCRANAPVPLTGWRRYVGGKHLFHDTCGTANGSFGLTVGESDVTPIPFLASWRWDAPRDLRLAGVRSHGISWSEGLWGGWRADDRLLGLGTVMAIQPSGRQTWELGNLNASTLGLELRCGEWDEGECIVYARGLIALEQVDLVVRDEFSPSVTHSGLSALSPALPLSGIVRLATDYVDRGGGVARADLLVDGVTSQSAAVDAASCVKPYVVPVPCSLAGRIGIDLDTTKLSDGAHNVELRVYDAAGNLATVGPVATTFSNHVAEVPRTAIAGRVSFHKTTLRSSYGTKARLEGSVAGLDDAPLAGVPVEVASRVKADGAPFTPVASAATDHSGRFTIPIEPGPSRAYRVRYGASEAIAEVFVRAPVTLRVTPSKTRNRRSVRFRGSITGATSSGVRVELQARAGKRWVPFRTAALKRSRFSATYRFTSTAATTRYRFRAVVRADPDLPYAANTSKTVSVLVRP
jgi:hypothetical protein